MCTVCVVCTVCVLCVRVCVCLYCVCVYICVCVPNVIFFEISSKEECHLASEVALPRELWKGAPRRGARLAEPPELKKEVFWCLWARFW